MAEPAEKVNGIPLRTLGSTGEQVTIIGMGGETLGGMTGFDEGVRILRAAIDEGINFLDNCWCYHGGKSEMMMGQALRDGYRHRVFLMTKTDARDKREFRRELSESLKRLETDHIDLLQFHNIAHDADVDCIFSEGGLEAAVEARRSGLIRYIGFTGHHWPHLFRRMLDQDFDWDTVQLPVNPLDAQYRSFIQEILPILIERRIGVIGMKSLSDSLILETGVTAREAISYALSMPVDTLVSGIDSMEFLRENLETVRNWAPLSAEQLREIERRVAPWAEDGRLERYKVDPE